MTMNDWYMLFRITAWLGSLFACIATFVSWSTRNMDNNYYYAGSKHGWWCMFWAIVFSIAHNYPL